MTLVLVLLLVFATVCDSGADGIGTATTAGPRVTPVGPLPPLAGTAVRGLAGAAARPGCGCDCDCGCGCGCSMVGDCGMSATTAMRNASGADDWNDVDVPHGTIMHGASWSPLPRPLSSARPSPSAKTSVGGGGGRAVLVAPRSCGPGLLTRGSAPPPPPRCADEGASKGGGASSSFAAGRVRGGGGGGGALGGLVICASICAVRRSMVLTSDAAAEVPLIRLRSGNSSAKK